MNVYCRQHARWIGVVDLAPGGFPQFHTRHPRWRDRFSAAVGRPGQRSNEFTNLREWSQPEVRGWCRVCGERRVAVTTLLEAFEEGRPTVSA